MRLMTPIAPLGVGRSLPRHSHRQPGRRPGIARPCSGPRGQTEGIAMASYIWIAVGSALGGVARYWCSVVAAQLVGEAFPWGTLFINILGSFVIGFFASLTGPDGRLEVGTTARQFVTIGLCGG